MLNTIIVLAGLLLVIGILVAKGIFNYKEEPEKMPGKVVAVVAVFGLAMFVSGNSFTIIETGHTGVKTTFGQISGQTLSNGFHGKIPFVQTIETVNNKQQDIIFSDKKIESETMERNSVIFGGITVTYRINPEKSAWIYANVSDYGNSLVSEDIVSSGIKSSAKTLSPTDATNRSILEPKAQKSIQDLLDKKYGKNIVFINNVVIKEASFDKEYDEKIAKKQQAQMDYEKQQIENKKNVEKAEADAKVKETNAIAAAKAKEIGAEAEAKANKKVADSITEKLIENKLAEARKEHGWVTVQGGAPVVTTERK